MTVIQCMNRGEFIPFVSIETQLKNKNNGENK